MLRTLAFFILHHYTDFTFLLRFSIKLADILAEVVHSVEALLVERDQIINTIYLVQREVGVYAVCPWRTGNEPTATDFALEFVTVEGIGPIHDELKIVEFPPFSVADSLRRFVRIQLIKTRIDTLFLCAFKVDLPSFFGIGRLCLVFGGCFFLSAKG